MACPLPLSTAPTPVSRGGHPLEVSTAIQDPVLCMAHSGSRLAGLPLPNSWVPCMTLSPLVLFPLLKCPPRPRRLILAKLLPPLGVPSYTSPHLARCTVHLTAGTSHPRRGPSFGHRGPSTHARESHLTHSRDVKRQPNRAERASGKLPAPPAPLPSDAREPSPAVRWRGRLWAPRPAGARRKRRPGQLTTLPPESALVTKRHLEQPNCP